MKAFNALLACAVLFAGSACTTVTVTEPIGESIVEIEPDSWEGLWRMYYDDDPVFFLIDVVDAENGILTLTTVEPAPSTATAYLRESNGWVFASYGDPDAARLEWVRIDRIDDAITFWMPDSGRFVDLVRSGRLPGTIDENDERVRNVTLTDLGPEHLDLITSGAEGMLLEWEKPGFLVRVSDEVGWPLPQRRFERCGRVCQPDSASHLFAPSSQGWPRPCRCSGIRGLRMVGIECPESLI